VIPPCGLEREELVAERVAPLNRIDAVLATLGARDYNPLLRNRRERLGTERSAGRCHRIPAVRLAACSAACTLPSLAVPRSRERRRE
jgi:transposase